MKFEKSNPILFSSDIKRSIHYFIEILEFEQSWLWGDPIDFGGVTKDEVEIFLCLQAQGHPGTWVTIVVNNVDEYYKKIKSNGAKILAPPVNQEWNMREMYVECPDGHILRIGQIIECD